MHPIMKKKKNKPQHRPYHTAPLQTSLSFVFILSFLFLATLLNLKVPNFSTQLYFDSSTELNVKLYLLTVALLRLWNGI